MRVIVERAALAAGLDRVKGAAKGAAAVYEHIVVDANGGGLLLAACDGNIRVTADVDARIEGRGRIAAHRRLADIVRKLPEGCQVDIEDTGGRLVVKTGRSRFTMSILSPDDLPTIPVRDGVSFSVEAAVLRGLIDKTAFAQATDETRYYLNGIYLHIAGDRLRAVATDGHRLSVAAAEVTDGMVGMPPMIVPRQAVAELARLLQGMDGLVEVTAADTALRVSTDHETFTSKLVDGTFPDYALVVPKANAHTCRMGGVQAFAAAMEDQLRAHDATHGGDSWEDLGRGDTARMLDRAADSFAKLDRLVDAEADGAEVARKAADVANLLMMVARAAGGLPLPRDEDET